MEVVTNVTDKLKVTYVIGRYLRKLKFMGVGNKWII
jgi:hypothetical protein